MPPASNWKDAMWQRLHLPAIGLLLLALLVQRVWQAGRVPERPHDHPVGTIVALGDRRYHVAVLCTHDGWLKLYPLGGDGNRVLEVAVQTLTAHVTAAGESTAATVELRAEPQPGDASGMTSCFAGRLPPGLAGQALQVSVPNLRIGGERFHLIYAPRPPAHLPPMPAPAGAAEEQELYRTPGGAYTAADIAANGPQPPSLKYLGFQARHEPHPQPGEPICPVTRTRADPACRWVIGGKTYLFCCPPCIDEFLKLARTASERLQEPAAYIKR